MAEEKKDLVQLARMHGLLGTHAEVTLSQLQCNCASEVMKKADFYTRAAAFLKCVNSEEEVDISDAAILRRQRNARKFVMEYKEALAAIDAAEDEESEGEEDSAVEEDGAAAAAIADLVDPETEQLLRGAKDFVRQTEGLKSFLEDILPEEGQGEPVGHELDNSTITSTISAGRKIAELGEGFAKLGDEPDIVSPDNLQKTLDKCAQILSEAGIREPLDDTVTVQ